MNQKKLIAVSSFLALLFFSSGANAQNATGAGLPKENRDSLAAKPKEEFKPSIKIGALVRAQAQLNQEATSAADDKNGYNRHWQNQLQLRSARVILNGELSKDLSFSLENELTGRLGNIASSKSGSATVTQGKTTEVASQVANSSTDVRFSILTAYATYKVIPELSIVGGLQNVGVWRFGLLQSSSKLLLPDAPSTSSGTFDNAFYTFGGRDIGVSLRGFVLDDKLEYRIGAFRGRTFSVNASPLRTTLRLNYNFLDVERGFTYQNTALGKGQYLSIGGGLDAQNGYFGYAVDFYYDQTIFDGAALTVSGAFGHFSGARDFEKIYPAGQTSGKTAFPTQHMLYLEAGLFLKESKFQPVVKFEWNKYEANRTQLGIVSTSSDDVLNATNKTNSNVVIGAGINYWITGNYNSSVKLLWEGTIKNRLKLNSTTETETQLVNGFTLQWQWFLQ